MRGTRVGMALQPEQGSGKVARAMTIEEKGRWLFGVNAVINWVVSVRGIVDPAGLAAMVGGQPPNYPFMLRLWSAFIFMFGCMFWEVSRDPAGKHALAKYNWIEKTLT